MIKSKSAAQQCVQKLKSQILAVNQRYAMGPSKITALLAEPPLPPLPDGMPSLIIITCMLCVFWSCSISFLAFTGYPTGVSAEDLMKLVGLCMLCVKLTGLVLQRFFSREK